MQLKEEQELRLKSKLKDKQENKLTDKHKLLLKWHWKGHKELQNKEKTDLKQNYKQKELPMSKLSEELNLLLTLLLNELRRNNH